MKEITSDDKAGRAVLFHQMCETAEVVCIIAIGDGDASSTKCGGFAEVHVCNHECACRGVPDGGFREQGEGVDVREINHIRPVIERIWICALPREQANGVGERFI